MNINKRLFAVAVGIMLIFSVFSVGLISANSPSVIEEDKRGEKGRSGNQGISIVSTSNISVSGVPQNDYFSWSHTTGEGEDKVMIVGISWSPASAEGSSVMYGSETLTRIATETNDVRTEIWVLKDPDPPGGKEYVEVVVGGDDGEDITAGAITLTGVDQNSPYYGATGNTVDGTSISVDLDSVPEDMVLDVVGQSEAGSEGSPTSNQTVQWSHVGGVNGAFGASSTKRADSGTTTMSWDFPIESTGAISAVTLAVSPPNITIENPAGGEEWEVGTEKEIKWQTEEGAGDITNVSLEYTADGGNNWQVIEEGLNDTGGYKWQVPDENSDQCQIRATVRDENRRNDTDISGIFAIGETPAPPENVTVEHWGDPVHPPMMVFDDFSDGDYTSDPNWTVYDGDWRVENETLEGQGRISTDESIHRAYGRWEYNFSLERLNFEDWSNFQMIRFYFIQTGNPDPSACNGYFATVTGELGGGNNPQVNLWRVDNGERSTDPLISDNWNADTNWHTLAIERDETDQFTLYLDGDTVGTATDGTYRSSDYKGFLNQGVTEDDDHKIEEIKVASGRDNRITWDASPDDPGVVDHYNVYRAEEKSGPWNESSLIGDVNADGSASYEYIDTDRGEADNTYWWYVVRSVGEIEEKNKDAVREPGAPEVEVIRPDGGEVWNAYEDRTIEWNMTEGYDEIDHVNLYSSNDGGETWDGIISDLDNTTEKYTWTVPNYNSSECLVRVEVVDLEGRTSRNVSEDYFTILGEPPQAPENLDVEHSDPGGELIENGIFMDDYEPWDLTRSQYEGDSRWHEDSYQADGSGSIYTSASQSGGGTTTEEAYWEQDVVNISSQITVNGAYNKNIWLENNNQGDVINATVEILVNDTKDGWKTIYSDYDNATQNSEWIEFGPDATYQPSGKVVSVRAHMKVVAQGAGGTFTVLGELWMDNISVVSDGTGGDDHNLVTWGASPDDPEEVAHYNIYRSKDRDGAWDETTLIANVTGDGSNNYTYLDENKGMVDSIYWWYVVRAVGENGLEENNAKEKQEPAVVDYIEVTPQDSTITAGETQGYNATAYDKNGNEIREVTDQTNWSIENGAGGGWSENIYTSRYAGTWNVTGEFTQGSDVFEDNATLTVQHAELSYVEIQPSEDQTITAGETIDFSAWANDTYDNVIEDDPSMFTWENTSSSGLFEKTETGIYKVTATYNDVVSPVTNVTVNPSSADHIKIEPAEETVTAGQSVTYTSAAYDSYGNKIVDVTANTSWSIDAGAGGSWSDNVYTSNNAGGWTVTGTYSGLSSTASLTVKAGEPDHLEISPKDATINSGETQAYNAILSDQYNNEIKDVTAETNWSIEDGAGGHWEGNVYHSENTGGWTVTGIYTVNGTELMDEGSLNVLSPSEVWINITHPVEGQTISRSNVTIEWNSHNAESHRIQLDGAGWTDVGMNYSHTFQNLDDGEHTVDVEAVGAESSVLDTVNFTVESSMPYIEITSPKEGAVLPPDVRVEWISNNVQSHEIKLDDGNWIDVGSNTTYTFEAVDGGNHTVEVRSAAEDNTAKDNVSFTVDPGALYVDILAPEKGKLFSKPEVTVEWKSWNAKYHDIKIEGNDWIYKGEDTIHTFSGLGDGEYTVKVRGTDDQDNVYTADVTFKVDTTPPVIEITNIDEGELFGKDSVSVQWDGSDDVSGIDYYEFRHEGGNWLRLEDYTRYDLTDLGEGEHTVEVKGMDEAGNSDIKNVTFLVDTKNPVIDITAPEEGETLYDTNVTVEWSGSDDNSGIDIYQVRIDGVTWIDVGKDSAYEFTDLSNGEHTAGVKASDKAGNENISEVSFTVDTQGGAIEVDIITPNEDGVLANASVTVEWNSEDNLNYQIRLDDGEWQDTEGEMRYTFFNLPDGEFNVEVRASDESGNSGSDDVNFLVDTTPPEIDIISPEEEKVFDNDSVKVEWQCSDNTSGVNYYQIRINGGEWKEVGEYTEHDLTDLSDGEYEVEIKAVDNAGNNNTETTVFEIDSEQGSSFFLTGDSCLLPLLLAIILAILLIAAWYGWKRKEETEEEKRSLQKKESPGREKKELTRSAQPPEKETSEWEEEPEPEESLETITEQPEISEEVPEPAGASETVTEGEEPVETSEGISEEGPDIEKLDVAKEFQKVKGIGSGIAHALYDAGYHSMEELEEAEVGDIKAIEGIGITQAELIHESIQKGETVEEGDKGPHISKDDFKAHQMGPMVKGKEMKKEPEEEKAPHIEKTDMEPHQVDSGQFEGEEESVEEETEVEEVEEEVEEIPKEEAMDDLSRLSGVGSSKAENLYESGFQSLEDLKEASQEEIQDVKGIGPALSEKIYDSLEELED
ncbi:MAG: hypothetical protein KGY76_06960 [Candidatus Thermoplasmatota archaeon]|nr:hypothetical protein [Candidatus Thermoplasmatota archaeon]